MINGTRATCRPKWTPPGWMILGFRVVNPVFDVLCNLMHSLAILVRFKLHQKSNIGLKQRKIQRPASQPKGNQRSTQAADQWPFPWAHYSTLQTKYVLTFSSTTSLMSLVRRGEGAIFLNSGHNDDCDDTTSQWDGSLAEPKRANQEQEPSHQQPTTIRRRSYRHCCS